MVADVIVELRRSGEGELAVCWRDVLFRSCRIVGGLAGLGLGEIELGSVWLEPPVIGRWGIGKTTVDLALATGGDCEKCCVGDVIFMVGLVGRGEKELGTVGGTEKVLGMVGGMGKDERLTVLRSCASVAEGSGGASYSTPNGGTSMLVAASMVKVLLWDAMEIAVLDLGVKGLGSAGLASRSPLLLRRE